METLTNLGCAVLSGTCAFWLSWMLTEWRGPVAHFKPLNCWPCLSFWTTLMLSAIALSYFYDAQSADVRVAGAAFAVLIGLINFIFINSKAQINE